MINLTATGTKLTLYSTLTLPYGVTITTYSPDGDPLDSPAMQAADTKMGANGDLIVHKMPSPMELNITTVPGSEEDKALEILFDANRVAKNKVSYNDVISLVIQYPDGKTVVLTNGVITRGTPITGITGDGRLKNRQWTLVFESKVS